MLDCCLEHAEGDEWGLVADHCHYLEEGARVVGATVFELLMSMEDRAQLVRRMTEVQTGTPMKMEEFKDGFMIYPEDVQVPDDARELE